MNSRFWIALCVTLAIASEAQATSTLSANLTLVSQYVTRGLRQSWGYPALQGGFDYSHASGLSAGFWGSTVSSNFYANADLEMDVYGAYSVGIGDEGRLTLGVIGYLYPGGSYDKIAPAGALPSTRFDWMEGNVSFSYLWLTVKASSTLTDYLGYSGVSTPVGAFPGDVAAGVDPGKRTRGSTYLEVAASLPVPDDLMLGLHAGYQLVTNSNGLSYFDARVGLSKTFEGSWTLGAAFSGTRGARAYEGFPSAAGNGTTEDISSETLALSLGKAL